MKVPICCYSELTDQDNQDTNQWFRLITSLFMHAGIFHLVCSRISFPVCLPICLSDCLTDCLFVWLKLIVCLTVTWWLLVLQKLPSFISDVAHTWGAGDFTTMVNRPSDWACCWMAAYWAHLFNLGSRWYVPLTDYCEAVLNKYSAISFPFSLNLSCLCSYCSLPRFLSLSHSLSLSLSRTGTFTFSLSLVLTAQFTRQETWPVLCLPQISRRCYSMASKYYLFISVDFSLLFSWIDISVESRILFTQP